MDEFVMPLMLGLDVASLTMSLVNIPGADALADAVETALRGVRHLQVERAGDIVTAATHDGHTERVTVVARLNTPYPQGDAFARVEMGRLFGPGASDAKGALAVVLKVAATGGHRCDVTFLFHPGTSDADVPPSDLVLVAGPTASRVRGTDLDHPWVRRLVDLTELDPVDAAVTGRPGTPVIAFGPGEAPAPGADEFVPTAELSRCEYVVRRWLGAQPSEALLTP